MCNHGRNGPVKQTLSMTYVKIFEKGPQDFAGSICLAFAFACVVNSTMTRKLSYRKDDRAMRPTYVRPENFHESLTMHTATFPEFLMGFCSD